MGQVKILIDNGHGDTTAGKRSPDGKFLEYLFNRTIAGEVVNALLYKGHDAELLVPEMSDVSLEDRVLRVNNHCSRLGSDNVCVISIHVNAGGDGLSWGTANGWECWYSNNSYSTQSKKLGDLLIKEAKANFKDQKIRGAKTGNLYITKNCKCASVLTENFFMDTRSDVDYITSAEGQQAVIDTHVNAIIAYVDSLNNSSDTEEEQEENKTQQSQNNDEEKKHPV